jgi:hypothetical protein
MEKEMLNHLKNRVSDKIKEIKIIVIRAITWGQSVPEFRKRLEKEIADLTDKEIRQMVRANGVVSVDPKKNNSWFEIDILLLGRDDYNELIEIKKRYESFLKKFEEDKKLLNVEEMV